MIEGDIEVTGGRWSRCCKQLSWIENGSTRLWWTGYRNVCWPVVRQTFASQLSWYWQCCLCECNAVTTPHITLTYAVQILRWFYFYI